ncbi:hypothetical protein BO78DRAFT_424065 [Aspergillus sclerotiicarbonarius CBS 121057]|uniref:Uncharacterized protein n=1 Tax=Aspergillus sclerotiicarbonarius (strain CBS 121057 / IBT 28362) TaxID=1448318 RepID=A0A319E308_ASPSB|nr:hypothetical protein BO78DRAFT_424065 [Aspergillus sclerotiicarbonarius CBS 121057]
MKLTALLCLLGASIAIATPDIDPRIGIPAESGRGGHSRRNVDPNSMHFGDPPNKFDPMAGPPSVEYPSGFQTKPKFDESRPRIEVTVVSDGDGVFPRYADPDFEETRLRARIGLLPFNQYHGTQGKQLRLLEVRKEQTSYEEDSGIP